MMTKECICKNGKKNPKCPACSKGDVNLDSFHRLNPDAKPKTAELFKIAAPSPGLWGGMSAASKQRTMDTLGAGLRSAAGSALPAAAVAALTADEGHRGEAAMQAGLVAGGAGGLAGALHHRGMTGKSDLAHSYQRGIGGDIRNMGNWGREQLGSPLMAHPKTPLPKPPAEVTPAPSVTTEAPKVGMFYEFGQTAALSAFAI